MPILPLTTPLAVHQSVALFDAARTLTRSAQYEALTRDQVALVLARIQMTASTLPRVLNLLSDELLYPADGQHSRSMHGAQDAYLQYIDLASAHLERAGERLNKAGESILALHGTPRVAHDRC